MNEDRKGDYVFPGQNIGTPLSVMALAMVLRRMKIDGVTVHGFRSAFRDWCADTRKDRDLAEEALAHAVGNAVERSYRRTDLFELRRELIMSDHAADLL